MILAGVALPLAIALLVLPTGWWLLKGKHYWPATVATGVAFIAAFGLLEGTSQLFPPRSAAPWLFYLGGGILVLAVLDSCVRMPAILRGLLVFLATGAAAGWLLKFNFTNGTWDLFHGLLWLAAIGAAATASWAALEFTASFGGIAAPMAMAATTGLAAIGTAMAADQTVGQGLGAMALVMTVALGFSLFSTKPTVARGSAIVVASMTVLLLSAATFVSPLELRTASIYALAPIALLVGLIPLVRRARPWKRITIQIIALMIALGIALGFAVAQFQRDKNDQTESFASIAE